MSILLTDKHVEEAVTLLALIREASNPAEVTRYQRKLIDLHREHPELRELTAADPRVEAKVLEIRAAFEVPVPVEACARCGHLTQGHRIDRGDGKGNLPVCVPCIQKANARHQPRKRRGINLGDSGEFHARRDR